MHADRFVFYLLDNAWHQSSFHTVLADRCPLHRTTSYPYHLSTCRENKKWEINQITSRCVFVCTNHRNVKCNHWIFLPLINGNITAKKCEFSMCVFRSTFAYSKFGIIYALHQYCYCNSHSPFLIC